MDDDSRGLISEQEEEELIRRYAYIVRACARPYFLVGGDSEDLFQEGMLGLLSAARTYDPNRGTKFSTYAEYCVKRRIVSAVRSAARLKHLPLSNYVSLESPVLDEYDSQSAYYLREPEEFVIASERIHEIADRLNVGLSALESTVLGMFLDGHSYDEMACALGKPYKSVDNAVQRIRKKLTRLLNYGDNQ
ncbi:MAG: sigma-70 family RNA polymerase sigma factor [Oscillospiraceae bacterium]|jgi:RNA polymerase sporulation-specific sigma factor|nr:sigma-70 family RNA polymerase sigma factor [Oscillospiraceae bacterium]